MEMSREIGKFEQAMAEFEAMVRGESSEPQPVNPVPCDGCTACCKGDAVRLLPEDDPDQYQTEPHPSYPGQLMLAHKENGDCVYLNGGCSIHGHKPMMCQQMDCRRLARQIKKKDLKKYNLPLSVWKRGRQLIGRSY